MNQNEQAFESVGRSKSAHCAILSSAITRRSFMGSAHTHVRHMVANASVVARYLFAELYRVIDIRRTSKMSALRGLEILLTGFIGLFVTTGIAGAASQCAKELPIAEITGNFFGTSYRTPAEGLQLWCDSNLPGSVLVEESVFMYDTPTTEYPYPRWIGRCYVAPTNPKPESPICPRDFTGGSCSGYDGSAMVPGSIRMDAPMCNGQSVGRLLCGGGDGYLRCPAVAPDKNINNCGDGNPINCTIGNKHQPERDFAAPHPLLSFERTYNSMRAVGSASRFISELGPHWRHSFTRAVLPLTAQTPTPYVAVIRPNGQSLQFVRDATSSLWEATGDITHRLVDRVDGSNAFIGYEFHNGESDDVEVYDANGRLLSITARSGVSVTLEYTSARLSKVTDSFGQSLQFQVEAGVLQSVTDPHGGMYYYDYDLQGNLASVTYPDGTQRDYHYNESSHTSGTNLPAALTGISDESATRFATFEYDTAGRATATMHAGETNKYTFTYPYNSAVVTDPLGNVSTRGFETYQGLIKIASRSQSAGSGTAPATSYSHFDSNGNTIWKSDFNGNQTTYEYDLSRNLETSRTEASSTAQSKTITTQWHPAYRLPTLISVYASGSATGTPILTTSLTYDSTGNQLSKTMSDPAANTSRTWAYTYNQYGQVLTADGPRTDANDVTTYTYYTCNTGGACGQVQSITNALGHTTTYNTYNAAGQPLTLTDPNGVVTTLTYDARQRLTSRMVGSETTSFAYWPTGLLKQVTLPDGSGIHYGYDAAHRLTTITDSDGSTLTYTLDAAGNRTQEVVKDAQGTVVRTHSRVFNALSQLSQDIGAANQTTTYAYDNNGNVTTVTDPLNRATTYQYDALNRLQASIDPLLNPTSYGYDANDNLRQVTDPKGLTTSYAMNGLSDLTQLQSPDTQTTAHTYDAAGNLKTRTDARGQVTTFTYDALNRVVQQTTADQTLSYQYDQGINGKGHLTGMSDANHSLSFQYDAQGRLISKTQTVNGQSKTASYAYSNGQLTQYTTPSGQVITYGYTNGKLTGINVNNQPLLSQVQYAPFGSTEGWTWGNGTLSVRQYDQDGRLTTLDSAGLATYTYHPDGTVATQTQDSSANLNLGTVSTAFTNAATSNRLTSASGALTRSYQYDAAGNTLSDGTRTFTYNGAGRMVTATKAGLTTTYAYNALGQRIKKANASGTTLFAYDEQGHLIGEYTNTGTLVQELVWLGDIPVATLRTDQGGSGVGVFYLHTDHLNSPQKVTRPSDNQVIWRWDHDAYGNGTPNEDPDGNNAILTLNLRYPGQYLDHETGLYYNYFRYYDPQTGRYVESDPIGLSGGQFSTYAYVGGNPMNKFDPKGLAADDICGVCSPGDTDCLLYGGNMCFPGKDAKIPGQFPYSGNWCGPGWTAGHEGTWEQLTDGQRASPKSPESPQDSCCMTHDQSYAACRKKHPCDKDARKQCMKDADRTLASCSAGVGNKYSSPLWWWMKFGSPDPGENSPQCQSSCEK